MSDNYHYEDGAKHYDHKKVLHIDKLAHPDFLKDGMELFSNFALEKQ